MWRKLEAESDILQPGQAHRQRRHSSGGAGATFSSSSSSSSSLFLSLSVSVWKAQTDSGNSFLLRCSSWSPNNRNIQPAESHWAPRPLHTHTAGFCMSAHRAHLRTSSEKFSETRWKSKNSGLLLWGCSQRRHTHAALLSVCVCVCVQEVKVCRCADNTAAPSHRAPWKAVCTGACVCARTQNSCIENQEVSRGVDKADRQLRENNCRGTHTRTHKRTVSMYAIGCGKSGCWGAAAPPKRRLWHMPNLQEGPTY